MQNEFDPMLPPPPLLPETNYETSMMMDSNEEDGNFQPAVENLNGVDTTDDQIEFVKGTDNAVYTSAMFDGILSVLWLVLIIILISSVFLIPLPFRVFWLVVVSLTILMSLGFRVYSEWMNRAQLEDSQTHEDWSMGLLYVLVITYALTMLAIMFILLWKIISVINSRTNIIRNKPPSALRESAMPPVKRF